MFFLDKSRRVELSHRAFHLPTGGLRLYLRYWRRQEYSHPQGIKPDQHPLPAGLPRMFSAGYQACWVSSGQSHQTPNLPIKIAGRSFFPKEHDHVLRAWWLAFIWCSTLIHIHNKIFHHTRLIALDVSYTRDTPISYRRSCI
jgi:hypothetical protein